MATKKTTTTNEEKFKKALEIIASGDAGTKNDISIQIATKALEDVAE